MKNRFWHSVFTFTASVVALLCLANPTLAQAGSDQPGVTPIAGTPWVWFVADDDSYQVVPSDGGRPGQFYPTNVVYPPPSSTGDVGWIVRVEGTQPVYFGPDFASHPAGSDAHYSFDELVPPYVATHGIISAVTGSGTATDPFEVTNTTILASAQLTKVARLRYVQGDDHAIAEIAISNTGSVP